MSRDLGRKDLRRAQRWGARRILDHEITILAWDMGSGKTVAVLTGVDDLLERGDIRRVLVVAPLLVAKATWPDEIEEWRHLRHLDFTLVRVEDDDPDVTSRGRIASALGRAWPGMDRKVVSSLAGRLRTLAKEEKRGRLASERSEIHIINREALPWLWEFFGNGKRWPYDAIIVDEASMFRSGKKRTPKKELSRFGVMAKARKFAKRTVLMTGTPAPKGLQNLWGLAYIADLGERLGTSKFKFEQRWFDSDYMGWEIEPKPHAFKQITERLSDIMFTLAPDDYAEYPDVVENPVKVSLGHAVMDRYARFKETLVSEDYDVEAVNRGVLVGKLLQFANGSMYREDGADVWIHDEKIDALETIVDEANGAPVLVAYSYRFDLKRILKRFPKAVIFGQGDVRETKRAWNNGEIGLMLAHPASVGHGQNIQFGGNINVWYGLPSDLELYQQFNKRLIRPGQRHDRVWNHHILAKGTYDEILLPRLAERDATQAAIMREFRLHISGEK